MMKKVYIFVGKARSGKDTAANYAMDYLESQGKACKRIAFADLLKQQARELGWNGEKDVAGRTFLQHLGDVMKEYHGTDYYAGHVLGKVLQDLDNEYFFITDCRFKTEWNLFKTCPIVRCTMVRIERPGFKSSLTVKQQHHASEVDMDDVKEDFLLVNDTNEDAFRGKVISCIQKFEN